MKKVLLIDTRSSGDWSLDLLWSGLVYNLGYERVIDYPPQKKHRDGKPIFNGNKEHDWGAERGSLSYTPENHLIPSYSEKQIFDMMKNKEIECIFVDEREESYLVYLKLKANFFDIPVILVAGHDKFWNISPQYVNQQYYKGKILHYFLDNWRTEYYSMQNSHLYNWSVNFDHLWDCNRKHEKIYDISFMGYNSHPDRLHILEHIKKKWSHLKLNIMLETRQNTFDSFVTKDVYFKQIAQSKIALNLRGAAENGKTLRYWEIPYVGSCMLSQDVENESYDFCTPLKNCHYFIDFNFLDDKIDFLIKNEEERELTALKCNHEVLNMHTSQQRIDDMFNIGKQKWIS